MITPYLNAFGHVCLGDAFSCLGVWQNSCKTESERKRESDIRPNMAVTAAHPHSTAKCTVLQSTDIPALYTYEEESELCASYFPPLPGRGSSCLSSPCLSLPCPPVPVETVPVRHPAADHCRPQPGGQGEGGRKVISSDRGNKCLL